MSEAPPVDRMNTQELRVLYFIEQHWHEKGNFPPEYIIRNQYQVNLDELLKKPSFQKGLANRGISITSSVENLSSEQITCILTLVDLNDRRSRATKLRDLGIKTATFQGWMKDEKFRNFFFNVSAQTFDDALMVARDGLIKAMENGDTSAIKFYLEYTNRYNPKNIEAAQFRSIAMRLLDVITRNCDPQVTAKIALEFDEILTGRKEILG